jgi:hypothetical protein
MTDPSEVFSEDEVNEFKRKLEEWSYGLSERERALLQAVIVTPDIDESGQIDFGEAGLEVDQVTLSIPLENVMKVMKEADEGETELAYYIKEAGPSWVRYHKHHHIAEVAEADDAQ